MNTDENGLPRIAWADALRAACPSCGRRHPEVCQNGATGEAHPDLHVSRWTAAQIAAVRAGADGLRPQRWGR